jgi:hypothetical protein
MSDTAAAAATTALATGALHLCVRHVEFQDSDHDPLSRFPSSQAGKMFQLAGFVMMNYDHCTYHGSFRARELTTDNISIAPC